MDIDERTLPSVIGSSKEHYFECPNCGGHYFGSYQINKPWEPMRLVRECHGDSDRGACGWNGFYENPEFYAFCGGRLTKYDKFASIT